MSSFITGSTIKTLREKKGYTQRQLAELLTVSDKTISKWETAKGLPDICLIEPLAKALGVSVTELISGEYIENRNRSGNMLRGLFFVCPICGNVIYSVGKGAFSCCGISLPSLEAEQLDKKHEIQVEKIGTDYYVTMEHAMSREHYISFFSYITSDRVQILKLYPEQDAEGYFQIFGQGMIYAYCNHHGLFMTKV
jgi:transcriptional regulator with XRE-family HTH domain/desulfoferrodoxin (superoxide reductase-like protein)